MQDRHQGAHLRLTLSARQARLRFQRQRRRVRTETSVGRLSLFLALLPILVGIALGTTGVVGGGTALAFSANLGELPKPEELAKRRVQFRSTKIVDRKGELLYEVFDEQLGRRTVVPLRDLPETLIQATVATEDADFFQNPGIDFRGIVRAVYQNVTGTGDSGGSTITQQVIRNVLIDESERLDQDPLVKVNRKIKEIVLAVQVNQQYSKSEILETYVNEIFYGNNSYGIEAAASGYFGKSAKELNLAESALLAGLPQSPSRYDPTKNPDAAKQRQEQVLDLMFRQQYITDQQREEAKAAPLQYRPPRFDIKAPHFVFYVRQLLERKYDPSVLARGGFTVQTTLDYDLQRQAEAIVAEHVAGIQQFNARNAALVSVRPSTGEIMAMVGSVDYWNDVIEGKNNIATTPRQPGSSIKPITYVTAFRKGYTPATIVNDEPMTLPGPDGKPFAPRNNDGKFRGPVKLRSALATSLNIPAIKVLQFAGVGETAATARSMGIESLRDAAARCGLALTLGGCEVTLLEMTTAFGVFATGGLMNESTPILKVTDANGKVVEEFRQPPVNRVLSAELSYIISDILSDNAARASEFGANSPLRLSRPAAAKTGTTDDSRDAWTVGYTPDLATGVWVGNARRQPMVGLLGSRAAGPIWNRFMEYAHAGVPVRPFSRPAGVIDVAVCSLRAPDGSCAASSTDLYVRGLTPRASNDSFVKKALVCKLDGKLADKDTCDPEIVEERNFLTYNGSELPPDLVKLGLPLAPTEKCDCAKSGKPISGTVTAGPVISGTVTPGATGVVSGSVTPGPSRTPGTPGAATAIPGTPTRQASPGATPPPASIQVLISAPAAGGVVKGTVRVSGSANVPDFVAYKLEVGVGEGATGRKTIAEASSPIVAGVLGSWATGGSRNGVHTLILTVVDRSGKSYESRAVIRVDN